ncbi:MAG: response regulator [Planctomycetota bacterium]|nr:response regulator [Planctomycetota bacterium]MDA0935152.1 response regulator [Planctomycetota bacterium]MDA1223131.1 response regulator [Planctomycetota bacterium]
MTETTILVVDDEPFICRSLSFVLRKDGHRVLEARDGEEALRRIREDRPDLVFLDVMMPKIDGFEVAETVRDDPELSSVRLVLLTARGQDADRARGAAAGVDAYVTKPFSPSGILGLCRDLLARPAAVRP